MNSSVNPAANQSALSAAANDYSLFDELPDGVLVVAASGGVITANTAFQNMVSRSLAEIVGQPLESIVADQDVLQFVGVEKMFGCASFETNVIFTTSDGTPLRLIVSSSRSSDGQTLLLTTRASGAVQQELESTTRWVAAEQERSAELAQARDALAINNASLVAAQTEAAAAYSKLKNEVAARERLEKDLRLAQKLEAIGQLAAGVAHEINTPMQYVGDNVAFLVKAFGKVSEYIAVAQRASTGETATSLAEARALLETSEIQLKLKFLLDNVPKALQASKSGIEHVSNIVRAMKSFAHEDQDEKTGADINCCLADTLMVAQSEYKSIATVETDLGELPAVTCFPGRLNQVFLNLIVNAAHAVAERGHGDGKIRLTSRSDGEVVTVTISDNGAGIPLHVQHKVFDPFFTTKPVGKGTGQGLSLARDIIVDAHGGTLSFETVPGSGTTFSVRLPVNGLTRLAP